MKFGKTYFASFALILMMPASMLCNAEYLCDTGYTVFEDYCYHTPKDAEIYENAQAACSDEGANLVSIHSAPVNGFMRNMTKDDFLIGLQYRDDTKNYTWSDGSPLDYTNYADGFVQFRDYFGYCAKMDSTGKWANAECGYDELKFVCRKKAVNQSVSDSHICPDANTIYADVGEITSPGYPGTYVGSASLECTYKVAVKNDDFVKIRVEEADFGNDYISVYKTFSSAKTNLVATITRYSANVSITVHTNMALLTFSGKGHGVWRLKFDTAKTETTCTTTQTQSYHAVDNWCFIQHGKLTYYNIGEAYYQCLFFQRAELPSVHSQAEQDSLWSLSSSIYGWQLIGLMYYPDGKFKWYDETTLTYTHFQSGYLPSTDDQLLMFNYDGFWRQSDTGGYYVSSVTCKKPASRVLITAAECPDPYEVNENSGEIFSPGYPTEYAGETLFGCKYRLRFKTGYLVYMYFVPLTTSAEVQRLYVYSEWDDNDDHLLGTLTKDYKLLVSTNATTSVMVVYDTYKTAWWQLSWYSTKDPVRHSASLGIIEDNDAGIDADTWKPSKSSAASCPTQLITNGNKHFAVTSPAFPSAYTVNLDCAYYSNSTYQLSSGQYWRIDFIRLRIGHDDYIKLVDLRTNTVFATTDTNIHEDLGLAVPFDFAVEFHSGSVQSNYELWRIVTYPNDAT